MSAGYKISNSHKTIFVKATYQALVSDQELQPAR